jgi:plasmid stabilization system protein ParE
MPSSLPLRYLPAAQEDILSILGHIALDSPSRAVTFTDLLDKRIGALSAHPQLGRVPRHPHLRAMNYRVLVIESYLVFYQHRETFIEIHRVVHGSRNLDHML